MSEYAGSKEWSPESIREKLKRSASPGVGASAQVFLHESVPAGSLSEVLTRMVSAAEKKIGRSASVQVGKLHPLAKSASVTGDPDVIAAMASDSQVKAILPSVIDDIYPKPLNVKEV
ncbi:MAG: hypothetical protein QOH65_2780 [Methylobacteriaceae bacterium]|jgi:hypothetical protein|nr:hypothetical protein [Methylobacteriaceae bacterium]